MNYIVKNCPCLKSQISYKDKLWNNGCSELGEVESRMCCQDITDCVIKQAIKKCKGAISNYSNLEILRTACETNQAYGKAVMAEQILQLFDIEEVRK